jgi:hypothetical protein
MTFDPQEVLRRFHRALLREIRAANPEYLHSPFSVAEIYQNLVPYRTHRDELGVEMNADYEHALLRLLAGEGDYLAIESRSARQEIREELESPNPNTGLYRDFAAADVRLNPEKVDEGLGGEEAAPAEVEEAVVVEPAGEEEDAEEVVAKDDSSHVLKDAAALLLAEDEDTPSPDAGGAGSENPDEETHEEAKDREVAEVQEKKMEPAREEVAEMVAETEPEKQTDTVPAEVVEEAPEEAVADAAPEVKTEGGSADSGVFTPDVCPWCRASLPDRAGMRFCPFCGSNVQLRPCPECGEELELKWQFCIACGTEVTQ